MKILRIASLGSYFTGSYTKECISVTESSSYFFVKVSVLISKFQFQMMTVLNPLTLTVFIDYFV